jgi:hypothetical protein
MEGNMYKESITFFVTYLKKMFVQVESSFKIYKQLNAKYEDPTKKIFVLFLRHLPALNWFV